MPHSVCIGTTDAKVHTTSLCTDGMLVLQAQHCTAGIVAGLASRLVTFPADTLKARLQVAGALERDHGGCHRPLSTGPPSSASTGARAWTLSTAAAARSLWRTEGMRGFFRGFGAVAVGAAPGQAAYFSGYELGNMIVPPGYGILGDMGVGCIAQLIAGVAFTPIDIIKERLQVLSPVPCRRRHGHVPPNSHNSLSQRMHVSQDNAHRACT